MFTAALLRYYTQQMETIQMSINGLMNKKAWYIHTIEFYSALKNNEILSYVLTWANLEEIMLSERRQLQKDKLNEAIHMLYFSIMTYFSL